MGDGWTMILYLSADSKSTIRRISPHRTAYVASVKVFNSLTVWQDLTIELEVSDSGGSAKNQCRHNDERLPDPFKCSNDL